MRMCFGSFVIMIFFSVSTLFPQSGTFDFETATTTGSPKTVVQTVGSRTVTVSGTVNFEVVDPLIDYSMPVGGITGKTACNPMEMEQFITISFNGPVNIRTLKVYEGGQTNSPGTMTFTPTGGSNSVVNYTPSPMGWDNNSKMITLNWVGITSIAVAAPYTFYWGFDDIIMDGALPVELTEFTAYLSNSVVSLKWKTATEVNNYGFEVERCLNESSHWEKIGFVAGNGNSNSPKDYSFTDRSAASGIHLYRLKQIDSDGKFSYSKETKVEISNIPTDYELYQNYPNPFNPSTVINYQIPVNTYVTLKVFDVTGNEVATLVNQEKPAGYHSVTFDAGKLSSGIYIYQLTAGEMTFTKKLILAK